MAEPREHKVKRLHMRSMRRGIKEMDLILPSYASTRLENMDDTALALYDDMLAENDHDLYQWVTGQKQPPAEFAALIADIQTHIADNPL
ncbi:antitoxin CptB [Sulfitobacter marinus]|uniref:FAD assembly factor SdhE n=1 Tax=Sulfitobacter marinus TaxID=394264 RepID=A0A1I6PIX5_9RHOB|nr:succinate dehydrogenase assembly factor 2 [Sulfitobacter marinus]SFS40048.1 antitoxin CptB [Sulfitobacter marinus]